MKPRQTTNLDAIEILLAETEAAIARVENSQFSPEPKIDSGPSVAENPIVSSPTAEITIDLPHGQTLTVKGLEQGAVVEIAAWRGTGPPDEDAVRMLFGANRNHTNDERGNQDSQSIHDNRPPERYTTETEAVEPEGTLRRARNRSTLKGMSMWRKIGLLAVIVGAVAALIAVLRLTNFVYFEHPDGGLTGGLGAASSTFVAVGPETAFEPNASVLVTIDGMNLVAGVVEVGESDVLVFTGDGQEVVPRSDVIGRVLFVVPFVGYFAG